MERGQLANILANMFINYANSVLSIPGVVFLLLLLIASEEYEEKEKKTSD